MIRQYCDRCSHDITNKTSAVVSVVADANMQGSGEVTKTADLCRSCLGHFDQWLTTFGDLPTIVTTPTTKKASRRRR